MKNITSPRSKFPSGATSLLIVVGLSLVLIVIITGLTTLSIRQSQQAVNTDLSNRARIAAEATARDAAQLLNQYPDLQVPNCDGSGIIGYKTAVLPGDANANNLTKPVISEAADNTTSVVCRTITSIAPVQNQTILKDQSTQFFTYLPTGAGVSNYRLLWGNGGTENQVFGGADTFPATWGTNTPAVIELTFVWWPKVAGPIGSTNFNSQDGLPVKTVVILPRNNNPDPSPINTYDPTVNCGGFAGAGTYSGFQYGCEMKVDIGSMLSIDPNSNNIVMKVKSRYKDSSIQAQFYSDNSFVDSKLVPVKSSNATIDVTAKVGDLYRRITAQKPVGGNSVIEDVLYSSETLCKTLTVYDDFSKAGNNCP